MGLKKAENQVKILLAETILSMCRNTLPYHAEICVEGLLGITLDNEEIFLVNINQTIKNQIEGPSAASKANESLKRSRKEQDNEGSESDPESSSNESEESSSKKRRKRGRRKKQKGEKSGSESDDGNLADESANVEATSLLPGADPTEVKFHNISPPDENPDGSEQYYDNSNQTADNDSQDATPSGVNVTVKQEPPGGPESDDDLVFVKQEVDDFNLAQPSSHQFSNLSQVFGNSSADTSLSQPDFMSSAFFNNPANNMSANAMQQAAVPGPSGANADDEMGGFAEISEEGFHGLHKKDKRSVEKVISSALRMFKEYLTENKPSMLRVIDVTEHSTLEELEELNVALKLFFAEAKQRNGLPYTSRSLTTMRYGLQKYFLMGKVDIFKHHVFESSTKTFKLIVKKMKETGEDFIPKPPITMDDLKKLYHSLALSPTSPEGLQNKVYVDVVLHLCKRSSAVLREIKRDEFKVDEDIHGRKYVEWDGMRMCEVPGSQFCPIASMEKYISLLSDECDYFWQRPRNLKSSIAKNEWYEGAPLGKNSIKMKMKDLSKSARLSQMYTNPSLKSTKPPNFDQLSKADPPKIIVVNNPPNYVQSAPINISQKTLIGPFTRVPTSTIQQRPIQFVQQPINIAPQPLIVKLPGPPISVPLPVVQPAVTIAKRSSKSKK